MPARVTWARSPLPKRYILQLDARRIKPGATGWSFRSGGVSPAGVNWRFAALPWLTGIAHPCLGLPYRPRPVFTARVALTAMLLLSTSVVFLTYMHKARSYGLAMLFAAIVLWAYWRVALHPRTPGRGARALLVLGATGSALRPLLRRAAAARAGAFPPVLRAQGAPLVAACGIARPGSACSPCHKCLIC